MKSAIWFGVGVLVTIALVGAVLVGGWALWRGRGWAMPVLGSQGMMGTAGIQDRCGGGPAGMEPGGTRGETPGTAATVCPTEGTDGAPSTHNFTLAQAQTAFDDYLVGIGYGSLRIVEVMEFDQNFYAIAQEPETHIGAMELLLDKSSGVVSPEIGPDMMWNAKYGMHGPGGMMGVAQQGENTISAADALTIAQQWLDAHHPGETVEDADPFYGYYTIHTESGGEIAGMLSVHGTTGQVWYHTWHGAFIQMTEEPASAN